MERIEGLITADEAVALYERITGRRIQMSTWRAYVARGQVTKPKRHVGRTPLWDPEQLEAELRARPRVEVDEG